jgi:hypothetical protein
VAGVAFERTQSEPYHDLIWAVLTLAENSFPGLACASGNLNARDWQHSLQWLEEIEGRAFQIPLRLDPERIWDILSQRYGGLELARQVRHEAVTDDPGDIYRLLTAKDLDLRDLYLKNCLGENDPQTLCARSECLDILNGTGDFYALVRAACLDADGPRWHLEQLMSIAYALGAFDCKGKRGRPARAFGFLPAPFLPSYYQTSVCLEKEEACRRIAALANIPAETVREMLQKIAAGVLKEEEPLSREPCQNEDRAARPDSGVLSRTIEFSYPEEQVNSLKEAAATGGPDWSVPPLKGLIDALAERQRIVLAEDTWHKIDQKTDPVVLAYVANLITGYSHRLREMDTLELAFNYLPEIRQACRNDRPWIYHPGQLVAEEQDWWLKSN